MASSLIIASRRRLDRQRLQDAAFRGTTQLFALGVLLLLGGVMVALAAGALPVFEKFGWRFLTSAA
jgi:ABC-type phosphate transport system permease subunit